MRPTRLILLVVALIAGVLAFYLATRGTSAPETGAETAAAAPPPAPTTQILVASGDIGLGQRLDGNLVQWVDWPVASVQPDYISKSTTPDAADKITGAVSRIEIFPGDPITEKKLVRADQGYLSAVLAKGMRGVSIPVTADASAGGFIVPNDRVDVIVTTSSNPPTSTVALSNVRVLAIGKRLGENGATGAATDPQTADAGFSDATIATLELSPGQAQTLESAKARGTLSLALRSIADFNTKDVAIEDRETGGVRVIRAGKSAVLQPNTTNSGTVTAADGQNVASSIQSNVATMTTVQAAPAFPAIE